MNKINKNSMWGIVKGAYFGHSNNEVIRRKASSGGILTEIACYLLKSHKVDVVVQIGADDTEPMKTKVVYAESVEEVIQHCGSRYTASSVLIDLIKMIDVSKKYAVIGKPCDIQVLKKYLNQNEKMSKSIVFLLSFFCAGTPSYQANLKLIEKLNVKQQDVAKLSYRGNGWPGKTTVITKDGVSSSIEYEESWGEILGRDLQEICRFCWDGVGEAADISCGDGWHVRNGKPSFEERQGRNVIFARTEIGVQLLEEMSSQQIIELDKISDLSIMKEMQPNHYMRKAIMFSRILAMRLFLKSTPNYRLRDLYPYAKLLSFKDNLKMFAGSVKRIIQKRM